jgi:hypothetical protein
MILLHRSGGSTLKNQAFYPCRASILRQQYKVIAETLFFALTDAVALRACSMKSSRNAAYRRRFGATITGVDQPALPVWSLEEKIELRYIQTGFPMQIGYVESFYGRLREDCLRANWFRNLLDAQLETAGQRRSTTRHGRTAVSTREHQTSLAAMSKTELWRGAERLRRSPSRHSSINQLDS